MVHHDKAPHFNLLGLGFLRQDWLEKVVSISSSKQLAPHLNICQAFIYGMDVMPATRPVKDNARRSKPEAILPNQLRLKA